MKHYPSLLISLIILLVYGDSLTFDFCLDDSFRILGEQKVSGKLDAISSIFLSPTFPGDLYRPLTTLLYRFQFQLGAGQAWIFHGLSLLLHIGCCILANRILYDLTKDRTLALACSCLFAIHPIQAESVSSIAGQAEILSCSLGLAALCIIANKSSINITASSLLFMSILAKESALTFLGLAAVIKIQKSKQINLSDYWLLIIAGITSLSLRFIILKESFFISRPDIFLGENPLLSKDINLFERLLPVTQIIGDYLRLYFYPFNLSLDYSRGYLTFWSRVFSADGLFSSLLCLLAIACLKLKQNKFIKYGIIWFFISIGLTCNLITPIGTLMAERLLYLPSLGLSLIVTTIIFKVIPYHFRLPIFAVIIMILGILSQQHAQLWANDRILFKQLAEIAPLSPKAHYITGKEYLIFEKDFTRAESHLKKSLELEPTRFGSRRELANLHLQQNNFAKAEFWIRKALETKPEDLELQELLIKLNDFKLNK